jgi:hypothetical protein
MRRNRVLGFLLVVSLLLSASGFVAAQSVSLSSSSLNFGNQAVMTTSAAKSVRLTNAGTAPLVVSSITPPSPPFADPNGTGACPSASFSLAPGTYCTISVTFSPTKTGDLKGSISITDNATGSPQIISLKGTGVPQAVLSPSLLVFGLIGVGTKSPAETATLQNNLSTALTITSIAPSGDFAVSETTCGASLAALSKCQISVTFTPTQLGVRSGALTVVDTANNSPQTISLAGAGTLASLSSISITPANFTIPVGSTQQFTATGRFPNNILLNLTKLVYWSSSATSVATISNSLGSQGLATGKAAGTTTIKASSLNGISGSTSLTVGSKTTAAVTLSNLAQIYNGTPRPVTVTTIPPGLAVIVTYNGSSTAPTNAGSYSVVATVNDPNYQGSASGAFVISPATATLALSNLAQTYDGTAKSATVTTNPTGLTGVSVTYNGSATLPVSAGSYAVVASLSNANYTASNVSSTFVISKGAATVTLGNLTQTYTGAALAPTATTVPANLTVTWTGAPDTNAGTYPVTATISNPNYAGSASGSFMIGQAAPTMIVTGGTFAYDGTPHAAMATATGVNGTSVSGSFAFTYNRSPTAPIAAGVYTVVATFTSADPNYGNASGAGSITITAPAATLVSIAITPSNSSILLGNNTQAFTATGSYSDGSTQDLTSSAATTWGSSITTLVTMSGNLATSAGTGTSCGGPTMISAASGAVTGSTALKVAVSGGAACIGTMIQARDPHAATLLNTGKVLITGGLSTAGQLTSGLTTAELYDPGPATSTATGPMHSAHAYHTATQLNDGNILIVGGVDSTGSPTTSAELYSPVANAFATVTGLNANGVTGLNTARYQHTATLLSDGTVLIVGGVDSTGSPTTSAELYNPATQTFTAVAGLQGSLSTARFAHTATLLRWGGVLIAGGYDSKGNPLASAELYDPSCTCIYLNTDNNNVVSGMSVSRAAHTATPLNDGTVLIVGGAGASPSTAEVYSPNTGLFALTSGNLSLGRYLHTSTMLTNGTILVAGGVQFNSGTATASEETYDPTTGGFTSVGNLLTARFSQTATLLPDGTVLIAGGVDSNGISLASLELYTPTTFTPTGFTGGISVNPTAPAIPLGTTVQFTASGIFSSGTQPLATVSWSSSDNTILRITNDSTNSGLAFPVALGPVTVTACAGTVCGSTLVTVVPAALVSISVTPANGFLSVPPGSPLPFTATGTYTDGSSNNLTASAAWSSSIATVATVDTMGLATPASPVQLGLTVITATEPSSGITGSATLTVSDFTATGAPNYPRVGHTASLLHCAACALNGDVLIAGGEDTASFTVINAAELYTPSLGTFSLTGSLITGRRVSYTATVLSDGRVLIVGGEDGINNILATAELYDPNTSTFSATGSMSTPRARHTATLLPNGKVLVAGGYNFNQPAPGLLDTAELYDPVGGTFSATGSMGTARHSSTATLLQTGQVLVAGGQTNTGSTDEAELYDPNSGTFGLTGKLHDFPTPFGQILGRSQHTATLLSNGQVLVAGGYGINSTYSPDVAFSELYDPSSGTFLQTGSLAIPRYGHTATLLLSGKVLIAGGSGGAVSDLVSCELYDPTSGIFMPTGNLQYGGGNTATLLPTGQVLIVGTAGAELYQPGP